MIFRQIVVVVVVFGSCQKGSFVVFDKQMA
jgi:lipoprotein